MESGLLKLTDRKQLDRCPIGGGSGRVGEKCEGIKKYKLGPGQCASVGWNIVPYTKRLQVQFLVRAYS